MFDDYLLDGVKERLVKNSSVDEDTGCWIWNKRLSMFGYGEISIKRRVKVDSGNKGWGKVRVPRLSYYLFEGDFDCSLVVRHICDNPACINPEHLVVGTHKDNMKDMKDRGRSNYTKKNNVAYVSMSLGRRKSVNLDGTWTWVYPEGKVFIKDDPKKYKRYIIKEKYNG